MRSKLITNIYAKEDELVTAFLALLEDNDHPWGEIHVSTEFNYQSGKTDVVACTQNGEVIAFEAKLSKWKEAIHQAYRSTSYADYSYVLLPLDVAEKVAIYSSELSKRNIGVVSIVSDEIKVIYDAPKVDPIHKRLKSKVFEFICHNLDGVERNGLKWCS